MTKAFTLIELMIVVAIIAIIAAIAIPNLMESKKAANEGNASTSLKTYCTAQQTYASNNYAPANNLNTAGDAAAQLTKNFADTWQLLGGRTGSGQTTDPATNQNGQDVALLPLAFAMAEAAASAWNGYFYIDIASNAAPSFKYNHGLCAVPAQYGTTGVNTFMVNDTAQVYFGDTGDSAGPGSDFDDEVQNATTCTWAQP